MKKKKIIWDIDEDLIISSPIVRKIIFSVKIKNRKKFCNWIGKISSKNLNEIDWWFLIPSSRNPYLSNLYNKICVLETINILAKKKYNLEIFTSSQNLYNMIIKWFLKKNQFIKIFLKKKKILL